MVTEECNLLRTFYAFAGKKGTKTKITVEQDKNFILIKRKTESMKTPIKIQGGSNMTGTDLCVNKPHCAAAVRP